MSLKSQKNVWKKITIPSFLFWVRWEDSISLKKTWTWIRFPFYGAEAYHAQSQGDFRKDDCHVPGG